MKSSKCLDMFSRVAYMPSCIIKAIAGILIMLVSGISAVNTWRAIVSIFAWSGTNRILVCFYYLYMFLFFVGAVLTITGFIRYRSLTETDWMLSQIQYRLFGRQSGNPLGLAEKSGRPAIEVVSYTDGKYRVAIDVRHCNPDSVRSLSKVISSALYGKFAGLAVIRIDEDPAGRYISFLIDNVLADRKIIACSVNDLICQGAPYSIRIQQDFFIDFRKSGSILIAGKTRSGKTTAIISILLQILYVGRDYLGSKVIIIDPKGAELSYLPHTYGPDSDGSAHTILDKIREMEVLMRFRQAALNHMSGDSGNQVKWWDAGMAPCILFLDEYVALQSFFPRKATKEDPDYSLQEFQDLMRRIVTMGASAGCFVIISTAEASVEAAGIPSMIRSAMGTKILMRPTIPEGSLMWDKDKLQGMPDRLYHPGDAWMSSTDGLHDFPTFVQFPELKFGEYAAMSKLLAQYYGSDEASARGDA